MKFVMSFRIPDKIKRKNSKTQEKEKKKACITQIY